MPLKLLAFAVAISLSALVPYTRATDLPAKAEKDIDPIEQLVAQLGSDDFTARRDAEAELLQLGAAAFDYLQAARTNPDLEIATQSQYLLYRVPIDWVRAEDPAEVRDLMTNYAGVNQRERREIILELAKLADGAGLAALSRIAHYDMSPMTAKYAAIGVLNGHTAHAKSALAAVETINKEIAQSPRDSVRWLRLYTSQLRHLDRVDSSWPALIIDETALLKEEDRTTSARLILGLIQFHVRLSQDVGDDQALFEALKGSVAFLNSQSQTSDANTVRVISRMLDKHNTSVLDRSASGYSRWITHDSLLAYALTSHRDATYTNLALAFSWVLDNQEWGVLPLLEKHYEEEIKADRLLLYLVAAAREAADQPDEANKLANRAHKLVAFDLDERNQLGEVVAEMGHHDWAEQEWQFVIEKSPTIDIESMKARRSIANWCLHDRGEDKAAADLLGEVCDAVDERKKELAESQQAPNSDSDAAILDETGKFYISILRTQREYFLACHLDGQGKFEEERQHLEAAFRSDQEDPDVLIAMFRLKEADDIYREKVAGRIRRAIDQVEQRIESDPEEPQWYNHYAWLVSNTQGDYDKAVRYSLKSLELCPNTPSYLDTLGRCYFAAGDIENAIKYQKQAVAMHPKVKVMQRQLEMFEQALADKK